MAGGQCGICAYIPLLAQTLGRVYAQTTPTIKPILSHVLLRPYILLRFILPLLLSPHFPLRYGNTTYLNILSAVLPSLPLSTPQRYHALPRPPVRA